MKFEEIVTVLRDLDYKGKKLVFKVNSIYFGEEVGFDILVKIMVKDRVTGKRQGLYTHYAYGPTELKFMTPSNIITRVKSMLIYLESHEVEEQLLYQGMRVFDPHKKEMQGPLVEQERRIEEEKIINLKKEIVQKLKEKEASDVAATDRVLTGS